LFFIAPRCSPPRPCKAPSVGLLRSAHTAEQCSARRAPPRATISLWNGPDSLRGQANSCSLPASVILLNLEVQRLTVARMRISIPASLSAFASWLDVHPVVGDKTYSPQSARYQVARYCEYLHSNPWLGADPLGDTGARDGAVWAYQQYLVTFDMEPTGISGILVSLDRFYVFLGLGSVSLQPSAALGR
jgi:hypothetical protein